MATETITHTLTIVRKDGQAFSTVVSGYGSESITDRLFDDATNDKRVIVAMTVRAWGDGVENCQLRRHWAKSKAEIDAKEL